MKKIVYALNRGDFTKLSPQVKSSYGNSQQKVCKNEEHRIKIKDNYFFFRKDQDQL